jgi:hypothetical protein
MLEFAIQVAGLDETRSRLERLQQGLANPLSLAERIARIMRDDVEGALLEGVDGFGEEVAELRPYTLKNRHGTGPPRIPQSRASRMIAGITMEIAALEPGYRISLSWDDVPFVIFHVTGTPRMAARNPAHLREPALEAIDEAIYEYVMSLIEGES